MFALGLARQRSRPLLPALPTIELPPAPLLPSGPCPAGLDSEPPVPASLPAAPCGAPAAPSGPSLEVFVHAVTSAHMSQSQTVLDMPDYGVATPNRVAASKNASAEHGAELLVNFACLPKNGERDAIARLWRSSTTETDLYLLVSCMELPRVESRRQISPTRKRR